jgi:integrase
VAGKRKRANGTWEYIFKRAGVLEKPIYMTFTSEEEGDAYAARLETLLDNGIVPAEHQLESRVLTIADLDKEYQRNAHPSDKDVTALRVVVRMQGRTPLSGISAAWVDNWIAGMKRIEKLAPASIRARVGALARCTDWGMRKRLLTMPDHPFRSLPIGYAQYTAEDQAKAGGVKREDIERERRLERGEHEALLTVIDGGVLERKRTPYEIPDKDAMRLLYLLAVESAMRMREMYTLRVYQVDLSKRTIFLDKTKNGDKRQVPTSSVARELLETFIASRSLGDDDLLFPWWDGDTDKRALARLSDKLSKLFVGIAEQAGCVDLKFHDLRHEATSRLFERTQLSETQIMKITGHKSRRMMMRYANLRGSDLAAGLW